MANIEGNAYLHSVLDAHSLHPGTVTDDPDRMDAQPCRTTAFYGVANVRSDRAMDRFMFLTSGSVMMPLLGPESVFTDFPVDSSDHLPSTAKLDRFFMAQPVLSVLFAAK